MGIIVKKRTLHVNVKYYKCLKKWHEVTVREQWYWLHTSNGS